MARYFGRNEISNKKNYEFNSAATFPVDEEEREYEREEDLDLEGEEEEEEEEEEEDEKKRVRRRLIISRRHSLGKQVIKCTFSSRRLAELVAPRNGFPVTSSI